MSNEPIRYPALEVLQRLVGESESWEEWLGRLHVVAPALSIYERHAAAKSGEENPRAHWAVNAASDAQWLSGAGCGPEDINLALNIVQKCWS